MSLIMYGILKKAHTKIPSGKYECIAIRYYMRFLRSGRRILKLFLSTSKLDMCLLGDGV